MNKCVVCQDQEVWETNELFRALGVCGSGCALNEVRKMRAEIDELKANQLGEAAAVLDRAA
jgi:hypothetical protein